MSARDERQIWNERYGASPQSWQEPDPFLVQAFAEHVAPAFPVPASKIALDLAGGAGRHAIYLASQGWPVEIIDISEVGLSLAQERAAQQGVRLNTDLADLAQVHLRPVSYDLIVVFYFLKRGLFPSISAALRPGGLLIYRTFTTAQKDFEGGPHDGAFLLKPNELLFAFPGLQVLYYRETASTQATAELVAKKQGAA